MTQVQLADALHILIGQREVEHIEVLLHTLLADGLRDDNHAALDEIAQGGLCRTLVILGTDGYQRFVTEEVVASLPKKLLRPSANGPHAIMCVPYCSIICCASICWLNTWVST